MDEAMFMARLNTLSENGYEPYGTLSIIETPNRDGPLNALKSTYIQSMIFAGVPEMGSKVRVFELLTAPQNAEASSSTDINALVSKKLNDLSQDYRLHGSLIMSATGFVSQMVCRSKAYSPMPC